MQPEKNFEKAATFIRSAAMQGAHLAVLPEYHLTNWLPHDPKFAALCKDWQQYLRRYQDLARECNICIVPGTIVQTNDDVPPPDPAASATPPEGVMKAADAHAPASNTGGLSDYSSTPNYLSNVAYFIDNKGDILGSYTKKNLWGPTERQHLNSSGRQPHPAIDTPLGKIGLLVCWDLAFPEAFRELIAQGCKMIVMPTFWTLSDVSDAGLRHNPSAEALFVDSTLVSRTYENTCCVVFANAGGPPGRGYMGLSQVTLPFVGPILRLGSCQEGMGVVDVDMQVVEDAEDNYGIRADLAREGWHYDYRHDQLNDKAGAADSKL
ncbi:MAG: hypothetical protein Q9162_006751 [Coniocarpon cinnabarinum]